MELARIPCDLTSFINHYTALIPDINMDDIKSQARKDMTRGTEIQAKILYALLKKLRNHSQQFPLY